MFQERNSATLLFSALCTRIFGVKRSKTDLSGKNSMSARMFFHRYPDLYPFLLNQVRHAAKIIEDTPNALSPDESSIYPALLILAKLIPTTTITDVEDIKYRVRFILDPPRKFETLSRPRLLFEIVGLIGAFINCCATRLSAVEFHNGRRGALFAASRGHWLFFGQPPVHSSRLDQAFSAFAGRKRISQRKPRVSQESHCPISGCQENPRLQMFGVETFVGKFTCSRDPQSITISKTAELILVYYKNNPAQ